MSSFLFAIAVFLGDLYDYIRGDRHITPSSVPNVENFKDILLANDQYYKDGIICKQEKDILLGMINEMEIFIKSKQESSKYDMTNNSKKLVLKIEDHDWGLKTIYTWNTKTWYIYDNLSVEYEIRNGENKIKSYSHKINDVDLKQIIKNIELAKSYNHEVQAVDGEAWEFIQYENGNTVWERKLGYIMIQMYLLEMKRRKIIWDYLVKKINMIWKPKIMYLNLYMGYQTR